MQFSLNWLQDFFNEPILSQTLEKTLTKAGLEVDSISLKKPLFEGVIVAKVEDTRAHPNADKLCIASVNNGKEILQVVCGAKNCRKGLITAFAPVDSILIDRDGKKHKLKKSALRGVDSYGMLLSSEELGLDEKSEGIIELSDDLKVGNLLEPHFNDEVLEISFTPNLGHAMSHLGIARETSALLEIPYELPKIKKTRLADFKTRDHINIHIDNSDDCFAYGCLLIKNVSIAPSPLWLKLKLEACGVKSINNVVDATNYILHEMGQPMHAFDFDLIEGSKIEVKISKEELLIETLDKIERKIPKGTLLITDAKKPIAIAGVMGASNSEVNANTKNILLESAHFNPKVIRKMSKKLGLYTEASKHFERGIDSHLFEKALQRAGDLIAQIANGEVSEDLFVISSKPLKAKKITCRLSKINRLLGTSLSTSEVKEILKRLEFSVSEKNELFEVTVPSYRNDIHVEVDLVEEVARVYGLDHIHAKASKYSFSQQEDSPHYLMEEVLHKLLLQEGLQEIITCDLVSPQMNLINGQENKQITALNYMSQDLSVLRTSLLAGHLNVLKHNQDHQNSNIQIYEMGKVYKMKGDCFDEQASLHITLSGRRSPYHFSEKQNDLNFFHLKGMVENVLGAIISKEILFEKSHLAYFHPGVQAQISCEGEIIGHLGEIHPSILRKLSLKQPVFSAELHVTSLIKHQALQKTFSPISPFPSSERDWTLTSLDELEIGHLIRSIKSIPSRILKDVFLIDIYKSEKIGHANKNVTLRFVYRNDKKTISFEAIEMEHARIISDVQAKMRSLIIEPT